MKKIVVLGCGLVGSVMVRDLSEDPGLEITVSDASSSSLDRVRNLARVETKVADLSDPAVIRQMVGSADAVVGAVPGFLGDRMLRAVIEGGKPIADISFSPENPLNHDSLAKERGVTAVVDCGVSPGLSNLAAGRAASQLDSVSAVRIFVGGLPVERRWPYEYRIVFSATDVIEEYTRPARLRIRGEVVVKPALSEIELIDLPRVGTLEAFNTDGLRTLLDTIDAPDMKEKTLRYPGHAERMRMLRESGFFSEDPEKVGEVQVVPRAFTERLLFRAWKRGEDERELTVLRVEVDGLKHGSSLRFTYDLFDQTDEKRGETSMARTTGFPCAIMARLLARGEYTAPGVRPPELFAGMPTVYDKLIAELGKRGVDFRETVSPLSDSR
ncbi:MAG TPA: saccharopine dehydrogenase C-terminal domain-containing protein [Thermoanaerobaculia bacterium]|nr:saccharopine dehydrogenase C-terminal domain-containing protein [Thermoanaerobaculia bacterium]